MKKILSMFIALGLVSAVLFGTSCTGASGNKISDTVTPFSIADAHDAAGQNGQAGDKTTGLGSTFIFDDLEITLGTEYTFVTIENQFYEHDGDPVIKLPIHVKNIGSIGNSLKSYAYRFYGSKGVQLDRASSFFHDDNEYMNDLRPGAEYDTYLHILYDGDGTYCMELVDYSGIQEVEFEITKAVDPK